jgi:RHS repeat-associated protein
MSDAAAPAGRPIPDSASTGGPTTEPFAGVRPPTITLPKGGGAIKGIGEKFAANPTTGAGAMTVPITASPGRAGFGPQLSLTYDSGAGNGPFGFGWTIALPAVTRKTDKGLPTYADVAESDVFILSGAEDLVPTLTQEDDGWVRETSPSRTVAGTRYDVQRYRPRVEGLFARIERWSNVGTRADVFWRSISRENITTWYGRTPNSRITDPADPSRIFSWLICESYDDKGNVMAYGYKPEDDENVDRTRASELNRERRANRYLKRIRYGNHSPYLPALAPGAPWPAVPTDDQWYFELVFDYGEHDPEKPVSADRPGWGVRPDPFSFYRSGFEVRTHRLCRRILMFHHFPDQPDVGADCLVRSTELSYSGADPAPAHDPSYSKLTAVTQWGHQLQGDGYRSRCLPPVEFGYSEAVVSGELRELQEDSLENLPAGLDGATYRWVDVDGEGLPGILSEQGGAWFYKRNTSPINLVGNDGAQHVEARFSAAEVVAARPALALAGGAQFLDLAGDGVPDVVNFTRPDSGFYEHADDLTWEQFTAFRTLPNRDWNDPNLRFVDLNGDGLADVLVTEHAALTWHPSLGEQGFGPERRTPTSWDDERGPALVFADGEQAIHLADMSGDGIADLVRIRNGEICYWPNLGYGRFGAKVTMDGPPGVDGKPTHVWFDHSDRFDQRRLLLADVDGSGTTDIVYWGDEGLRIFFNQSGNSWATPVAIPVFPPTGSTTTLHAVDLLGNGTACLVWSSPLPADTRRPLRYLDLMGGQKPHLLVTTTNNLGTRTDIQYAPSTKFYLQDKAAGQPWATKLPFPVHVVERVTTNEKWRNTSFSSTYSYHHGYFDGPEREFRGFGRVEQVDVEDYGTFAEANVDSPYITSDHRLFQPPVKTITWFHTGAFIDGPRTLHQFAPEYFPAWFEDRLPGQQVLGTFREHQLTDPDVEVMNLTAEERREALRACKGMALRQEVYELNLDALMDGREMPARLFTATSHACHVAVLQPRAGNRHAVFHATESESVKYHYDLDLSSATLAPDPRIYHVLNLNVDEFGNVLQAAKVGYPRWPTVPLGDALLPPGTAALIAAVQASLHLTYVENHYTADAVADPDDHRLRLKCETEVHELSGLSPADAGDGHYFTLQGLTGFKLSDRYHHGDTQIDAIPHHQLPDPTKRQKRPIRLTRSLFFNDALDEPLPLGELTTRAVPYETYSLALTDTLLSTAIGGRLTPDVIAALGSRPTCGYLAGPELAELLGKDTGGQFWRGTGIAAYDAAARQHFYLPTRFGDAFGNVTQVAYDPLDLFVRSSTDPLLNRVEVAEFDYRVMRPSLTKDINGNCSAARYDVLGLPAASATSGKHGEGDDLDGLDQTILNPDSAALVDFFVTDNYDAARAKQLLRHATTRHVYYFGETVRHGSIAWGQHPACAAQITREQHAAVQPGGPVQAAFEYSDGLAAVLVKKVQAEPENPAGPLRWVSSGKAIQNNKGNTVKQYEPYFSADAVGHRFEEPQAVGATSVNFYDAAGRKIRTDAPDGSFSAVEFSPWQLVSHDSNDTVLDPGNRWYARNSTSAHPADRRVAQRAAAHAHTPTLDVLDSLGRVVVTVAHNRTADDETKHCTFVRLDIEGRPMWVQNPLGKLVIQHVTPPLVGNRRFDDSQNITPRGVTPTYDLAGQALFQHGTDGGERWTLFDAAGKPCFAWSSRGFRSRMTYDELRRPVAVFVSAAGTSTLSGSARGAAPAPDREILAELRVYGELHPDDTANLRGKSYQVYDGAGVLTSGRYDFKANLLTSHRRFCRAYESVPDWTPLDGLGDPGRIAETAEPLLEPSPPLVTQTTYDALNRVTATTTPDGSVYNATFNAASFVERIEMTVRGTTTTFVTNVDYNARGQRERVDYGNGATTRYGYDPNTFRLRSLRTTRPANPDVTASQLFATPTVVQDMCYTFDPVGNITRIEDTALQITVQAGPAFDFVYDALYRLIAASGREHAGQTDFVSPPPEANHRDYPFAGARIHPNDLLGLRGYVERYRYDAVGNVMEFAHHAGREVDRPGQTLWKRHYQYALDSNRLLATSRPGDPDGLPDYVAVGGYSITYDHDAHGNVTSMAHLPVMRWNYKDQLSASGQQVVNGGSAEITFYVYDFAGNRVRTVTETRTGAAANERRYVNGYELYREYSGAVTTFERETLHVVDNAHRIAIVETETTPAPAPRLRYQFENHLGSVSLELDGNGALIGYEEYHPYGTTSFQAGRSAVEVSAKRYRHTGKERDEQTGFTYHGTRYYAPWLGRWISCDPAGFEGGDNFFRYCADSPMMLIDPTGEGPKGASEGSVLTGTIDPTLDKKGIGFNTETRLELTLRDGTVVHRRVDRFYQDPHGDWNAIEAKGDNPEDLTPNELAADRRVQLEGARFKVIKGAGAPPPGHGQLRQDIAFTPDFVGEIKPGNFQHVHGNVNHLATENLPATATAALWKHWMEGAYADAPGHENMVRKINPNAAPTWITREQAAAEYAKNTGRQQLNPVERATGYLKVTPKDHSPLAANRGGATSTHQFIAGTVVAAVVVTSPLWIPAVVRAAPATANAADKTNRVRIVIEKVAGPQFRIYEEHLVDEAEHLIEEGSKKALQWVIEYD